VLRCGRCGRRLHVRYWGKSGTSACYLCRGAYDAGGKKYCLGFGGRLVDARVAEELVRVLSPLGVRASLAAIAKLSAADDARCAALRLQLEQLEYEAQRAFEQYNEVDPRNRLVASELCCASGFLMPKGSSYTMAITQPARGLSRRGWEQLRLGRPPGRTCRGRHTSARRGGGVRKEGLRDGCCAPGR
jgi:hypothetical protein